MKIPTLFIAALAIDTIVDSTMVVHATKSGGVRGARGLYTYQLRAELPESEENRFLGTFDDDSWREKRDRILD